MEIQPMPVLHGHVPRPNKVLRLIAAALIPLERDSLREVVRDQSVAKLVRDTPPIR